MMNFLTSAFGVSLSISIIIIILILSRHFITQKYAAKIRYWVWLVLALRLLLPFSIHFGTPVANITMPDAIIYTAPELSSTLPENIQPDIPNVFVPSAQIVNQENTSIKQAITSAVANTIKPVEKLSILQILMIV